ncbi:hypothetical protein BaRGS_00011828 [Batillaria attramentaria]|uniref:Uncharacterized protein n=1 Tax=Batillaria attramentaria TaxID=370345 RepID=A0ABD0LC82_9CAEN
MMFACVLPANSHHLLLVGCEIAATASQQLQGGQLGRWGELEFGEGREKGVDGGGGSLEWEVVGEEFLEYEMGFCLT